MVPVATVMANCYENGARPPQHRHTGEKPAPYSIRGRYPVPTPLDSVYAEATGSPHLHPLMSPSQPPDRRRRTKPPPPSFRTVAAGLNPPPRSLPPVQRRHTKPTLPRAPTREIHLRPTLRRSRDDGNPSPAVAARPTPPHEATPAVIPACSGGFETRLRGHCRQSNAATRSHPCLVPRHGKSISGLLSVVPVTTGTHPQRLPPDQRRRTKPPPPSFRPVAAGLKPASPVTAASPTPPHEANPASCPDTGNPSPAYSPSFP